MAMGARNAIAAARPDWLPLPFIGCDGLAEGGQSLVKEGKLAATIILQSAAGPAIDLLAAHLRSGAQPPACVTLAAKPYPA
jgi:ribose transport system substrate-binding protein